MEINKAFGIIRRIVAKTINGEFQVKFDENHDAIRITIMTGYAELGYYESVIGVLNKTSEIKTDFDDDKNIVVTDIPKPEPEQKEEA